MTNCSDSARHARFLQDCRVARRRLEDHLRRLIEIGSDKDCSRRQGGWVHLSRSPNDTTRNPALDSLGITTTRNDVADAPGRFGWDGAFGTSWGVDPKEELVGVLMAQRRPDRLAVSPLALDFWTSAYQLIDD
jgi:CubicO group peptidase (beta-lactamase class C family)